MKDPVFRQDVDVVEQKEVQQRVCSRKTNSSSGLCAEKTVVRSSRNQYLTVTKMLQTIANHVRYSLSELRS